MNPLHDWKMFRSFAVLLVLFLVLVPAARPQDPQYTMEEYQAYQAISAEAETGAKTGLIVGFLKKYPKSTLRQHVMAAYQGMMTDLNKAQKWPTIISAGEKFLTVVPDDLFTFSMLAAGYQNTNNYKQFVVFGEKAFQKNPSGNLAYYLAKAYKELKNDAKFLQWGQKAVEFMPDNHEILQELARLFAVLNRQSDAAKYAGMCIKAIRSAKKPEGTDDALWNKYTSAALATSYAIVGNVEYEQKRYTSAITNLEASLKYHKRNDLAYYFLGLSYWQANKVDMAMLNLAKSYLLNGSSSNAAKQHLDNLYKSTHQQTLTGIERVINRAKLDLK